MFILSNFIQGLAAVLNMALTLYMWIVIISVILSWVSADPYNPIVRAIRGITEPVFYRVRRTLPMVFGGIDFSPIIVIGAIMFCRIFIVNSLYQAALRLK